MKITDSDNNHPWYREYIVLGVRNPQGEIIEYDLTWPVYIGVAALVVFLISLVFGS